jgi:hypothetical protein
VVGPAGGEHGVAADVDGLLADLHDAAHDHVVDEAGVEVVALCSALRVSAARSAGCQSFSFAVALAERWCGRRRR